MRFTLCCRRLIVAATAPLLLLPLVGCVANRTTPRVATAYSAPPPIPLSERLSDAQQAYQKGDIYPAIVQWEIAAQQGDQSTARILQLAKAYAQIGEWETAVKVLSSASAKPGAKPDQKVVLLTIQLRLKLGDFLGAATAVKPLFGEWKSLPLETQQALIRTLLLAGEAEKAAPYLPVSTDDSEWLALSGLSELVRNRPQQAALIFEKAVARSPNDPWNLYLSGYAWEKAGNRAKATIAWHKAATLKDAPPALFYSLAQIEVGQGNIGSASALLQSASAQGDSQDDPAYWKATEAVERARHNKVAAELAWGYALFHAGDPWQAEAVWARIVPESHGADTDELYAALHNSAFKRQDATAALRWATAGTTHSPENPYFHKRRAEALLGQNRLKEAESETSLLEKTMANSAGESAAAREVEPAAVADLECRIALDSGKVDTLRRYTDHLQQIQPGRADGLLYLAEWQTGQGRDESNREKVLKLYTEAEAIATKNTLRNEETSDILAQKGILLADLKRYDAAVPVLLYALTLWSRVQEGAPHAQLAAIYQRQGKAAEAVFHTARYAELRQSKTRLPALLKAMREPNRYAVTTWKELGALASERRENWLALCAFRQATKIAPKDPEAWRGLAAVYKRNGAFTEALEAVLRSRLLRAPLSAQTPNHQDNP